MRTIALVLLGCAWGAPVVAQDTTQTDSQQWTWKAGPKPAEIEKARSDSIIAILKGDKECQVNKKRVKEIVHFERIPADTAAALLCGTIWVGMSEDQLLWALGRPNAINRTETADNLSEQLVYDHPRIRGHRYATSAYVYVDGPARRGTHYNGEKGAWEQNQRMVTAIQISD